MLQVTCAIIEYDEKILCAQRSETMNLPLKWEFPGGKVESGESLETCLHRELREELGIEIKLIEKLPLNRHIYPNNKEIILVPFRCSLEGGELTVKEHKQVKWLSPEQLIHLDWANADVPILKNYLKKYHEF